MREQLGGLDVVVWCAGYWDQFDAAAWDADSFERHVQVNLLGLNNVLAAVIPGLVRARTGHLVGVASVAGYRGLAGAEQGVGHLAADRGARSPTGGGGGGVRNAEWVRRGRLAPAASGSGASCRRRPG